MFRSSTVIRELALNLAKVIFTLKHSVKLRRHLLCGCVAACFSQVQCTIPDDGRRPKRVEAIFMCTGILMQILMCSLN